VESLFGPLTGRGVSKGVVCLMSDSEVCLVGAKVPVELRDRFDSFAAGNYRTRSDELRRLMSEAVGSGPAVPPRNRVRLVEESEAA